MKKKSFLLAAAMLAFGSLSMQAFDLNSILGNAGTAVQGVVDGLLTQTDISVEQMAGTWTAQGSAVAFQSENALKKAGGSAIAGTVESKLDPYYKKYGLTGSTLTIQEDGSFVLKVKSLSLKGTIKKRSDGNFDFTFTPFGNVKLGAVKTYVEKPAGGLNVMFDASKLKTLLTTVTKLTGSSLASAAGNVLESYDGLLVGFSYKGQSTYKGSSGTGDAVNKAADALKNIFGK